MIVYISGPMTGVKDYKERFQAAADILIGMGHTVVNPANIEHVIDGLVTCEKIMEIDLALLAQCEAICLLPGWEMSKGARKERVRAKELRLVEMEGIGVRRRHHD